MANNCLYQMTIKGQKNNVEAFLQTLCADWPDKNITRTGRHQFYRIFSAEETQVDDIGDGNIVAHVVGDCAWSIEHSMCDKSHNGPVHPVNWEGEMPDITIVDLESETETDNVRIEVYAKEPGNGFQEHYVIENGKTVVSETCEYHEYYWDGEEETFDEFKEFFDLPNEITEEDLTEGTYSTGGFDIEWEI